MKTTSRKRPSSIGNPHSECQDRATVKKMIDSYKNHPSVATIKENVLPDSLSFDLPSTSKEDINKIVDSLNANKAVGPDGIPLDLIKLSSNIVERYLTNIINHDILQFYFSNGAKNALVSFIYKKKDR